MAPTSWMRIITGAVNGMNTGIPEIGFVNLCPATAFCAVAGMNMVYFGRGSRVGAKYYPPPWNHGTR